YINGLSDADSTIMMLFIQVINALIDATKLSVVITVINFSVSFLLFLYCFALYMTATAVVII
ncbi:7929_t:CDS:2, partial [Gigaspora margarita]